MTLRNILMVICALLVVATLAGYVAGWTAWPATGVTAAILLVLIAFERTRYRPKVDLSKGEWIRTGERFEDPSTGETMEVYANPRTGERDYRRLA